ncbi:Lrp/AsnC ligand binding domain-containing protein [Haloarculaceae archaeon H-GB11]|nr:Lrp/AsnC ligand binding domain-containing protein [Haloarculaceae archaeon H-GB11]
MVRAFVMVKTAAGKSEELLENAESIAGIDEAHIVAGEYDIIAEASGEEVYDVMHSVATDVRDLEGVTDTRTYIALE